jgi:hypothetical protein
VKKTDDGFDPATIEITMMKRVGNKEPEIDTTTSYSIKAIPDGDTSKALNGSTTNGKATISLTNMALTNVLKIEISKGESLIDKLSLNVVEDGAAGTSYVGTTEWYWAVAEGEAAPTDNRFNTTTGVPINTNWKSTIAATNFNTDATKKRVYNFEITQTQDYEGTPTFAASGIEFFTEKGTDGRGIAETISYYAVNDDAMNSPDDTPTTDGKSIIPGSADWSSDGNTGAPGKYVWEASFIKYDKADLNGNIYEDKGITCLSYFGMDGESPYIMVLSNDNASIVVDKNDKVISTSDATTTM